MFRRLTRQGNTSFLSSALLPAFFILTLLFILVLPSAANELNVRTPATVGSDDRPHPVHARYELSVDQMDFGVLTTGEAGMMAVTVTNTGPGTIPLKVKLAGDCAGFSLPGVKGKHYLRPGQSVTVQVEFAPVDPGVYLCSLEFGQQVPAIAVQGGFTDVELDADSLDFAEVIVGQKGTHYLKLTNPGNETYTLDLGLVDTANGFSIRSGQDGYLLGPDNFVVVTVDFDPTVAGLQQTLLILGAGLPRVEVSGMGIEPVGSCSVSAGFFEFGPLSPGQYQTETFLITNTGNIDVPIRPSVTDPNFTVTKNATILKPGRSWRIAVTFKPLSWGTFNTQVDLGNEFCGPIDCTGIPTPGFDPDQDNVGLFFDTGLSSNRTTTSDYFEIVDVYLAMLNPSGTAGIGAWECRVGIDGKANMISTHIEGTAINLGSGSEFVVGIAVDPLPYSSAIQLASFQLVMQGAIGDKVELTLNPNHISSVPGLMSWIPWDDLTVLKPMFPVGGEAVVAIINPDTGAGKFPDADLAKAHGAGTPAVTRILPNAPNPFNPQTEVRFELAKAGPARLAIFDVSGRLIKTVHTGHLEAAQHTMVWAGRDNGGRLVASGVYYLRMETEEGVQTRKMMMLK